MNIVGAHSNFFYRVLLREVLREVPGGRLANRLLGYSDPPRVAYSEQAMLVQRFGWFLPPVPNHPICANVKAGFYRRYSVWFSKPRDVQKVYGDDDDVTANQHS